MKKGLLITLGVVVALLLLVGGFFVGKYNSMVTSSADVDNAQGEIETVLQERYDLIPNLVESVKAVLTQEQALLNSVTEARKAYAGAASESPEKLAAANELESALSRLLVVIENYPELKSDATVQSFMDSLSGLENRLRVARIRYNDSVTDYNKLIKVFPNNLFAGLFNFEERDLFEAAEGAETAPKVDLSVDE